MNAKTRHQVQALRGTAYVAELVAMVTKAENKAKAEALAKAEHMTAPQIIAAYNALKRA